MILPTCDFNYLFLYILTSLSQVRNELCYSAFGHNTLILFNSTWKIFHKDVTIMQLGTS